MDGRGEDLAFLLLKRGMTRDVVQGPPRGWDFGREKNLVVQVLVALPLSLSLWVRIPEPSHMDTRAYKHTHALSRLRLVLHSLGWAIDFDHAVEHRSHTSHLLTRGCQGCGGGPKRKREWKRRFQVEESRGWTGPQEDVKQRQAADAASAKEDGHATRPCHSSSELMIQVKAGASGPVVGSDEADGSEETTLVLLVNSIKPVQADKKPRSATRDENLTKSSLGDVYETSPQKTWETATSKRSLLAR